MIQISPFYRTIAPLTHKHIENSLTNKKGEMGSSHVKMGQCRLYTRNKLISD